MPPGDVAFQTIPNIKSPPGGHGALIYLNVYIGFNALKINLSHGSRPPAPQRPPRSGVVLNTVSSLLSTESSNFEKVTSFCGNILPGKFNPYVD